MRPRRAPIITLMSTERRPVGGGRQLQPDKAFVECDHALARMQSGAGQLQERARPSRALRRLRSDHAHSVAIGGPSPR